MLILSRKLNEQIIIGDDIVITVVAIRGSSVRLGIDAPTHIPVHREEIYEALREQRRNAEALEKRAHDSGSPVSPSDKQ